MQSNRRSKLYIGTLAPLACFCCCSLLFFTRYSFQASVRLSLAEASKRQLRNSPRDHFRKTSPNNYTQSFFIDEDLRCWPLEQIRKLRNGSGVAETLRNSNSPTLPKSRTE